MHKLTLLIVLFSAATGATGSISLGIIYYQDFPIAWFFGLILLPISFRYRRELDYELRSRLEQEEES